MPVSSKTNADFSSGLTIGTIQIFVGAGAPTLSAKKGSLYINTNGSGVADRMYVNTNGTTGWTNFTTAA